MVNHIPMTFRQRLLLFLSDPNIAYLLLILGMYGIIFEIANPGAVLPGVVGSISVLLGLYALQLLPVNYAGLLLILLAIILFIAEIKVPSYGALTIGGIISMLLGSLMLIRSPFPYMRISLTLIVPVTLGTAAFFFFLVGAALQAQLRTPYSGREALVGAQGIARTQLKGRGKVFVEGEIWDATSTELIEPGEEIEVIGVQGLTLQVKKREKKT
ncbi:MAG: hypothetical protein D6736_00190 [Nitrospinota bacterium]|nr:MAG: hypothetical protein D6736_00190 [Nitrospinota bacterium]